MASEVINLGACLLNAPYGVLADSGRVQLGWSTAGMRTPATYTLDEMIQAILFARGDLEIPPIFRDLCGIATTDDWQPERKCFNGVGAVLVEINSPITIKYGRYALCRSHVAASILNPLHAMGGDIAKAETEWYWQGMMAGNLEALAKSAQILARAVAEDAPNPDLQRAVLVDARPLRRDVAGLVDGLRTVCNAVSAPIGIVTYTHQYMPDGRPLPWPADFVEQTVEAATQLGLPVFTPSKYVASFGAERALMPDRIHYRPEFSAALAEPLWEFVQAISTDQTSRTKAVT